MAAVEYEVRKVQLPRDMSRSAARQLLTDEAEYGQWELARLRVHADGRRDVWLRRKIIRAMLRARTGYPPAGR